MDINEITNIASAINRLRPDWSQSDLVAFITRDFTAWDYRDAAVVLTWVACDPDTRTPRRALEPGPWRDAISPAQHEARATNTPPRLQRCKKCGYPLDGPPHMHVCKKRASPEQIEAARRQIRAGLIHPQEEITS